MSTTTVTTESLLVAMAATSYGIGDNSFCTVDTAASPAPPSAASAPSPPPAAAAPLAPSAGGFRVQLPTRAGFRVRPPTQSRRLPSPAAACFCPPASGGHLLFNLYSSLIHISTFLISFWGRLKNILCTPK